MLWPLAGTVTLPVPVSPSSRPTRFTVVVLGDLGRSPRMLLQALSLAESGSVDLVGYEGAALPARVRDHSAISVHRFPAEPPLGAGREVWIGAARRLARQSFALASLLLRLPRPDLILVQNPPPLPALPVIWTVARLRGARWVIDWHNLGSSMLALKLGDSHRGTRSLRRSESFFGRRADGHLCVSAAMRDALASRFRIAPAHVLYDRPAAGAERVDAARAVDAPARSRPALVVSPTSWTLDEDYGLLLDALDHAQARITRERSLGAPSTRRIVVLLTGLGPERAGFEERARAKTWTDVEARTGWFEPERYRELLASADLGLSLHRSASGLDLPMKIPEMLGADLPVATLAYGPVLDERFRPGEQGFTFSSAAELGDLLVDLFRDDEGAASPLGRVRRALRETPIERWQEGWRREAYPLIARLLGRSAGEPERRP